MSGTEDRGSRREKSRARVEHEALALFRRRGFDAVTVEDISAAAGIAPATFYRYFGTKHGVLFAYQPAFFQAISDAARRLDPSRNRTEQILDLLVDLAGYFEAHGEAMSLRDEVVLTNPNLLSQTLAVQRQWEAKVAQSLAEGRGLSAPDDAARMDAALVLVVIRLAFRAWRTGAQQSFVKAVRLVFDEAGRALSGP